jgi:hypothetical protein
VGIEHLPGLLYYGMVTLKLPLLEMSDWTSAPPHDDVTTGHWGYSLARCILFSNLQILWQEAVNRV